MRTRVLVADDDNHVISSLSQLLETAGYSVVGKARTGREACLLNAELDPDVVLLDLKMPDMDGVEAAEQIMDTHPAPVVLCTAYCDEELVACAARAGVYAYVLKPFRLAELVSAITVARHRYADVQGLQQEVGSLEKALEERKLIEKAKGIIMRTRGVDEEQAHKYLQRESQRRSQKAVELAQAIITAEEMFRTKVIGRS